ncbi:MAG: hypothetical protein HYX91_03165 [Chloroflexi bacterium]|nr:hypothetical protein [Chloroflexota bacterium]
MKWKINKHLIESYDNGQKEKYLLVDTNSGQNPHRARLMGGRTLIIISMLVLLELALAFFLGLAYCLLMFWLFHLTITGTRLMPKLAKPLLGTELYERNRDWLIVQGRSKSYKVNWLVTNLAFLVLLIISFKFNVKLIDIIFG